MILYKDNLDEAELAAECHRMASTAIEYGDSQRAVEFLELAKPFMEIAWAGAAPDQWLRLPRLLQALGRYDAAMAEMDYLLGQVDRRAREVFAETDLKVYFSEPHQKSIVEYAKARRRVYWKARREIQLLQAARDKRRFHEFLEQLQTSPPKT